MENLQSDSLALEEQPETDEIELIVVKPRKRFVERVAEPKMYRRWYKSVRKVTRESLISYGAYTDELYLNQPVDLNWDTLMHIRVLVLGSKNRNMLSALTYWHNNFGLYLKAAVGGEFTADAVAGIYFCSKCSRFGV